MSKIPLKFKIRSKTTIDEPEFDIIVSKKSNLSLNAINDDNRHRKSDGFLDSKYSIGSLLSGKKRSEDLNSDHDNDTTSQSTQRSKSRFALFSFRKSNADDLPHNEEEFQMVKDSLKSIISEDKKSVVSQDTIPMEESYGSKNVNIGFNRDYGEYDSQNHQTTEVNHNSSIKPEESKFGSFAVAEGLNISMEDAVIETEADVAAREEFRAQLNHSTSVCDDYIPIISISSDNPSLATNSFEVPVVSNISIHSNEQHIESSTNHIDPSPHEGRDPKSRSMSEKFERRAMDDVLDHPILVQSKRLDWVNGWMVAGFLLNITACTISTLSCVLTPILYDIPYSGYFRLDLLGFHFPISSRVSLIILVSSLILFSHRLMGFTISLFLRRKLRSNYSRKLRMAENRERVSSSASGRAPQTPSSSSTPIWDPKHMFDIHIGWLSYRAGSDLNELIMSHVMLRNPSTHTNTPYILYIKQLSFSIHVWDVLMWFIRGNKVVINISRFSVDTVDVYFERNSGSSDHNIGSHQHNQFHSSKSDDVHHVDPTLNIWQSLGVEQLEIEDHILYKLYIIILKEVLSKVISEANNQAIESEERRHQLQTSQEEIPSGKSAGSESNHSKKESRKLPIGGRGKSYSMYQSIFRNKGSSKRVVLHADESEVGARDHIAACAEPGHDESAGMSMEGQRIHEEDQKEGEHVSSDRLKGRNSGSNQSSKSGLHPTSSSVSQAPSSNRNISTGPRFLVHRLIVTDIIIHALDLVQHCHVEHSKNSDIRLRSFDMTWKELTAPPTNSDGERGSLVVTSLVEKVCEKLGKEIFCHNGNHVRLILAMTDDYHSAWLVEFLRKVS